MPGDITRAVHRWRDGDDQAQTDLMALLVPLLAELLRQVRHHVNPRLKARIDSAGVVNAAVHSFLTGVRKGEFPVLDGREDVRKVLTALVSRTLTDEVRWHTRRRRTPAVEVASADGRPAEAAAPAAADEVQDLAGWLDGLAAVLREQDERAMEIVRLSLEGLTNADVARQLGLGVRQVQVLKKRLRECWDAHARGED